MMQRIFLYATGICSYLNSVPI